jgi:hypothetical protein
MTYTLIPTEDGLHLCRGNSVNFIVRLVSLSFLRWGGVRLSPLGTSATNWLIVPAPDDRDECGAVGGMRIDRRNRSTPRKPVPMPLSLPKTPHYLTWARTRAVAVGSRQRTSWPMSRSCVVWLIQQYLKHDLPAVRSSTSKQFYVVALELYTQ